MTGSLIWLMSPGRITCNTGTSLGREASTNGSLNSQRLSRERDGTSYEHKTPRFVDVVKEFYANMVGIKDRTVYVRGKWISFSREQIDRTYNL